MTGTAQWLGDQWDADLRTALARAARSARLVVACDYDGTVSRIVANPMDAVPADGAVAALQRLAVLPSTTVALLSGRARRDLQLLSGLGRPVDGVQLIGSHGAERGPDLHRDPLRADAVARLIEQVDAIAGSAPGVYVEHKPLGVAVHVRGAQEEVAVRVVGALHDGPALTPGVRVIEGKKVVDLMLDDTDKGDALRALVEESGADRAVVLGDDVTDEWAFAAAGADDVTVKVGAGETGARFRVATVPDAVAVLAFLASQRAASQRASAQADEVPSHDRSNDGRPGTASG